MIILALLIVPAAAVVFSLRQQALYSASAEVLMSKHDLAALLTNTQLNLQTLPDREAATQADVAHTPRVAREMLTALKLTDRTTDDLLKATSVTPSLSSDIITFSATDPIPWSPIGWARLGDTQRIRGNNAGARTSYRVAIARDPNDYLTWLNLALASTGAARTTAAREALRLNPLSPEINSLRPYLGLPPLPAVKTAPTAAPSQP